MSIRSPPHHSSMVVTPSVVTFTGLPLLNSTVCSTVLSSSQHSTILPWLAYSDRSIFVGFFSSGRYCSRILSFSSSTMPFTAAISASTSILPPPPISTSLSRLPSGISTSLAITAGQGPSVSIVEQILSAMSYAPFTVIENALFIGQSDTYTK